MPELPEVESAASLLRENISGLLSGDIAAVTVFDSKLVEAGRDNISSLAGSRFVSIGRHGKYIFCRLKRNDGECFLVFHLRMTGRLQVVAELEAERRHVRLEIRMANGSLLFEDPRRFGRVWILDGPAHILKRLGPDALSVSRERFMELLVAHDRQLKPLLLDQGVVAGVGNIYADEILFSAGLHPALTSRRLTSPQMEDLHAMLISVLSRAVETGGANIDGVFKAGQFRVSVYGRAGEPCIRCGTPIVKIRVAQRGTHICPACQVLEPVGQHAGMSEK